MINLIDYMIISNNCLITCGFGIKSFLKVVGDTVYILDTEFYYNLAKKYKYKTVDSEIRRIAKADKFRFRYSHVYEIYQWNENESEYIPME